MKLIIHAILILSAMAMLTGCVKSEYKTRSFMTEEEIAEVESQYFPSVEAATPSETGEPVQTERTIEPFLIGIERPVMKVNGLDVMAADVRGLYEYYASYRQEESLQIKQAACQYMILVYAIMSQWPDKIQYAMAQLNQVKSLVTEETDFSNFIVELTQEPEGAQKRGDFGERTRGQMTDIYEMHAFTDPIHEVSGPFPDILGWFLIQPIERNDSESGDSTYHARHLVLVHGLDPQNTEFIRANVERFRNQAQVELLLPELNEVLPWYAEQAVPAQ